MPHNIEILNAPSDRILSTENPHSSHNQENSLQWLVSSLVLDHSAFKYTQVVKDPNALPADEHSTTAR